MSPSGSRARASSNLAEFTAGVVDQLPILLGVVPFGLIFGALAVRAGIAVGLVADGTPPIVVVLTILVVNLRHMLYSANLGPYLADLPRRWKLGLSWLLTDEAFALASVRYQKQRASNTHWYMLGTGLALWVSWQASTAIGITLGTQIPERWALDFALPLTFMALIAPTLVDRPTWAAALGAGVLALALVGLPFKLNLVIAVVVGVTLGLALENRDHSRTQSKEKES
jgi:predicted branched-subunit amino acid permease